MQAKLFIAASCTQEFSCCLLSQVEKLEVEVAELKRALSDKQEQETAMVQVRAFWNSFTVTKYHRLQISVEDKAGIDFIEFTEMHQ